MKLASSEWNAHLFMLISFDHSTMPSAPPLRSVSNHRPFCRSDPFAEAAQPERLIALAVAKRAVDDRARQAFASSGGAHLSQGPSQDDYLPYRRHQNQMKNAAF
jgi:hypothetical protein